jgi:L-lactate utilization protein LutB
MMSRLVHLPMFGVALGLLAFATPRACAEHPLLHAALSEMREARTELKEGRHDFGGHRAKALEALDYAIVQVEKALRAVGDNVKGAPFPKDAYRGYSNHPHVRHALVAARDARNELSDAAHDYKGHRVKALEAMDAVVHQLDEALKYAR